jgi:CMP-N,N'-diacetyllegionaminic acid synthase
MYNNQQVLCFILARGGSKGVLHKNKKLLNNKPLIKHSIDVAKQTKYVDEVYVSTDDVDIKEISLNSGAKVIQRSDELASDTAVYLDAVKHLIDSINVQENSIIVLLETTSPIRTKTDIENCFEIFDNQIDCVISVTEVKIHPAYMYRKENQLLIPFDDTKKLKNRQEMEKLYAYTGSILLTTKNFLQNQELIPFGGRMKGYLLDEASSIDIDTPLDFDICEFVMKNTE